MAQVRRKRVEPWSPPGWLIALAALAQIISIPLILSQPGASVPGANCVIKHETVIKYEIVIKKESGQPSYPESTDADESIDTDE